MSARLVSSQATHLGLQMVLFLLCSPMVFLWCLSMSSFPPLIRKIHSVSGATLSAPFQLNQNKGSFLQIQSHFEVLGVRTSTCEFRGDSSASNSSVLNDRLITYQILRIPKVYYLALPRKQTTILPTSMSHMSQAIASFLCCKVETIDIT